MQFQETFKLNDDFAGMHDYRKALFVFVIISRALTTDPKFSVVTFDGRINLYLLLLKNKVGVDLLQKQMKHAEVVFPRDHRAGLCALNVFLPNSLGELNLRLHLLRGASTDIHTQAMEGAKRKLSALWNDLNLKLKVKAIKSFFQMNACDFLNHRPTPNNTDTFQFATELKNADVSFYRRAKEPIRSSMYCMNEACPGMTTKLAEICELESEKEAKRATQAEGKSINTEMVRIVKRAVSVYPNLIKSVVKGDRQIMKRGRPVLLRNCVIERNPLSQNVFMRRLLFEAWAQEARVDQSVYKGFMKLEAELTQALSLFLEAQRSSKTPKGKRGKKGKMGTNEVATASESSAPPDTGNTTIPPEPAPAIVPSAVQDAERGHKLSKASGLIADPGKISDTDTVLMKGLVEMVSTLKQRNKDKWLHCNDLINTDLPDLYDVGINGKTMLKNLVKLDVKNAGDPTKIEFFVGNWVLMKSFVCHQTDSAHTFSDKWKPMDHLLFSTVFAFGVYDSNSADSFIALLENNGRKSVEKYRREYAHEVNGKKDIRQIVSPWLSQQCEYICNNQLHLYASHSMHALFPNFFIVLFIV